MADIKTETFFTFDELEQKLLNDTYPFYEFLLSHPGQVFAVDKKNADRKILLLSRYDEVSALLGFNQEISCDPDYLQKNNQKNFWSLFLLNTDGKDHILMRKILSNYFTKERLNSISVFIEGYLPNLMNSFKHHDEMDLIEHVAEALPLSVLGHMIGVGEKNSLRQLRDWTIALNPLMDSFTSKDDFTSSVLGNEGMHSLAKYAESLISERKNRPGTDLISYVISECEGKNVSNEKTLANIIFMLIASHDTTVNMIANGIFLLLRHPEELEKLLSNPDLAYSATEEILRFESPTQRASYRITKEFIQVKDIEVASNTQVIVFLGAANRDSSKFINPNEFNISRENNNHLAFGHGIHNCLGKTLARLEGNLVFPAIAPILSKLELKEMKPNWRKNTLFRIQKNLLVSQCKF